MNTGILILLIFASFIASLVSGAAMLGGTFIAKRFIRKIEKGKFRKYIAVLLCAVGLYMLIFRA